MHFGLKMHTLGHHITPHNKGLRHGFAVCWRHPPDSRAVRDALHIRRDEVRHVAVSSDGPDAVLAALDECGHSFHRRLEAVAVHDVRPARV